MSEQNQLECKLCIESSNKAMGNYYWGNACCRARFLKSLPHDDLRVGWLQRWKAAESSEFYSAIEKAVESLEVSA